MRKLNINSEMWGCENAKHIIDYLIWCRRTRISQNRWMHFVVDFLFLETKDTKSNCFRQPKKTRNVIWSRTVAVSCRDLCSELHLCKKCWIGKSGAKCEKSNIITAMAIVRNAKCERFDCPRE